MTEQARTDLKKLQRLDTRIAETQKRVGDFDPRFEEVEEPALILQSELETTRKRVQEMKLEERRLELASEEKRARVQRLEERLGLVRTLREEAAVSAELEMVKRALQSDEQEAYTLLDQIRKLSDRLEELEEAYAEAEAHVEPARQELLAEREAVQTELTALQDERKAFADGVDADELRTYEAIRGGGRNVAVAELTEDGACGNCFGIVPLQVQNEIRHGSAMIRCEACGVILSSADPESKRAAAEEAAARQAAAEAAATEAATEEGGDEGTDDAEDAADDTEEVVAEE